VANSLRLKFDFASDLDRNVERQLGHANGTPGVSPDGWTEDLDDEIGEAVYDAWLPVEVVLLTWPWFTSASWSVPYVRDQ
jgi:hypothetical protein